MKRSDLRPLYTGKLSRFPLNWPHPQQTTSWCRCIVQPIRLACTGGLERHPLVLSSAGQRLRSAIPAHRPPPLTPPPVGTPHSPLFPRFSADLWVVPGSLTGSPYGFIPLQEHWPCTQRRRSRGNEREKNEDGVISLPDHVQIDQLGVKSLRTGGLGWGDIWSPPVGPDQALEHHDVTRNEPALCRRRGNDLSHVFRLRCLPLHEFLTPWSRVQTMSIRSIAHMSKVSGRGANRPRFDAGPC